MFINTNDQRFRISGNPDFRSSDNPELRKSDNSTCTNDQGFRISENPGFRISDNPDLREYDNSIFRNRCSLIRAIEDPGRVGGACLEICHLFGRILYRLRCTLSLQDFIMSHSSQTTALLLARRFGKSHAGQHTHDLCGFVNSCLQWRSSMIHHTQNSMEHPIRIQAMHTDRSYAMYQRSDMPDDAWRPMQPQLSRFRRIEHYSTTLGNYMLNDA